MFSVWVIVDDFFFFNDTSTTEIYTYLHALSIRDARPICRSQRRGQDHPAADPGRDPGARPRPPRRRTHRAAGAVQPGRRRARPDRTRARPGHRWQERSEEHPSELQQLMRIPSAVFCLTDIISLPTKKPKIPNTIQV